MGARASMLSLTHCNRYLLCSPYECPFLQQACLLDVPPASFGKGAQSLRCRLPVSPPWILRCLALVSAPSLTLTLRYLGLARCRLMSVCSLPLLAEIFACLDEVEEVL